MKKYIIIPGCSDLNRGDQALVWETKRLAEEAGFKGEFYLTSERNEPVEQSEAAGIRIIRPIIEHPSRMFKDKSNIKYNASLKIKWGVVAAFDLLGSFLLLCPPARMIANLFLSSEKKQSLRCFKEADAIFVKGGGLLQTYGGISSSYSMYFWCYHLFLARTFNKPIYVMPNSFGPFEGPFVATIARKALRSCKVITSRESLSTEMVSDQLGLKIETYPDLAFRLKPAYLDKDEFFERYNIPTDKKLVALTMRPYRFPNSSNPDKAYKDFKDGMASFIRWLYGKGYMPIVVEHTLAVNDHENDGACIQDVISRLGKEEYRFVSNPEYNCHDLKRIYSFCDYIVGTRFHSMIFALGSGVPGIAISYVGNKSKGIMKDIGLSDYVIGIDEVTDEILKDKFQKLVCEENDIARKVEAYINYADGRYADLIEKIRQQ